MVGLLEGAAMVFGGAAEKGFEASGEIASDKLKNAALMARENNLARIKDFYNQKSQKREWGHEEGVHKMRMEESEQTFQQRLDRELAIVQKTTDIKENAKSDLMKTRDDLLSILKDDTDQSGAVVKTKEEKADELILRSFEPKKGTAFDWAKVYDDAYTGFLKATENSMDMNQADREAAAQRYATSLVSAFRGGGTEKLPQGGGGAKTSLQSLVERINQGEGSAENMENQIEQPASPEGGLGRVVKNVAEKTGFGGLLESGSAGRNAPDIKYEKDPQTGAMVKFVRKQGQPHPHPFTGKMTYYWRE